MVTCEIKQWNNFEIISVFYCTCNHCQWLHVKQNTKIISKFFENNFISHVTTVLLQKNDNTVWHSVNSLTLRTARKHFSKFYMSMYNRLIVLCNRNNIPCSIICCSETRNIKNLHSTISIIAQRNLSVQQARLQYLHYITLHADYVEWPK